MAQCRSKVLVMSEAGVLFKCKQKFYVQKVYVIVQVSQTRVRRWPRGDMNLTSALNYHSSKSLICILW